MIPIVPIFDSAINQLGSSSNYNSTSERTNYFPIRIHATNATTHYPGHSYYNRYLKTHRTHGSNNTTSGVLNTIGGAYNGFIYHMLIFDTALSNSTITDISSNLISLSTETTPILVSVTPVGIYNIGTTITITITFIEDIHTSYPPKITISNMSITSVNMTRSTNKIFTYSTTITSSSNNASIVINDAKDLAGNIMQSYTHPENFTINPPFINTSGNPIVQTTSTSYIIWGKIIYPWYGNSSTGPGTSYTYSKLSIDGGIDGAAAHNALFVVGPNWTGLVNYNWTGVDGYKNNWHIVYQNTSDTYGAFTIENRYWSSNPDSGISKQFIRNMWGFINYAKTYPGNYGTSYWIDHLDSNHANSNSIFTNQTLHDDTSSSTNTHIDSLKFHFTKYIGNETTINSDVSDQGHWYIYVKHPTTNTKYYLIQSDFIKWGTFGDYWSTWGGNSGKYGCHTLFVEEGKLVANTTSAVTISETGGLAGSYTVPINKLRDQCVFKLEKV